MNLTIHDFEGRQKNSNIDHAPDTCPICHHAISPNIIYGYYRPNEWHHDDGLQVLYRCPRLNCQKLFISNYGTTNSNCDNFSFKSSVPLKIQEKQFSNTIKKISPNFCSIYNQAFSAESEGLSEVCGSGYRKSLEFLIKDYLISLLPKAESEEDKPKIQEREEQIKKKWLGDCITEDITNINIKNVAQRAAWLGNDEAHYLRKWENKDLSDLKKLIELTVHWLEMEALTAEAINDMP